MGMIDHFLAVYVYIFSPKASKDSRSTMHKFKARTPRDILLFQLKDYAQKEKEKL